jgi:dCTP deaminase
VIEPGWRGFLTLELTNHGPETIKIMRAMPIAQILFHFTDKDTVGYEGKYQDQERGPQEARHDKV